MTQDRSDYESWREVNGGDFSRFDYLRGVLVSKEVHADGVIAVWKLLRPDFIEVEGMVFLREEFREEKFQDLKSRGMQPAEIEFWMNLLAVGAVLDQLPAAALAEMLPDLRQSWEDALEKAFPGGRFDVRLIEDDGDDFLVFQQRVE